MHRRSIVSDGRFMPRVESPGTAVSGDLVQTQTANLAVDTTTAVEVPVYSTLLSVTITTTLATADLDILFYCSFDFTGVLGSRATSFRLRLDGVLIPPSRAAVDNSLNDEAQGVAINRRVLGVAPGLHTVIVEWSKFGTGTLQCLPATRPDEQGAHLKVEEQRP